MKRQPNLSFALILLILLGLLPAIATAQQEPSPKTTGNDRSGIVSDVSWSRDGKSFTFSADGKKFRYDLDSKTKQDLSKPAEPSEDAEDAQESSVQKDQASITFRPTRARYGDTGKYIGRPARGRQYTQVESPDEQWVAEYKDWNLILRNKETDEVVPVTTEGNEQIHFGTASWVYGEELNQRKAMWWTKDSSKIVYYRFDDTDVQPFYLVRGWSEINTSLYPEYYPKAGAINPAAELYVYDLKTGQSTKIDLGGSGDEYIYNIRVSPDGEVMLVNWTDRLQQHLKVMAIDLETGKTRLVVEEQQPFSWQENAPGMRFLEDSQRFVWPTDKSGFTHYELRNLDGELLNPITQGDFQITGFQLHESDGLATFVAHSSPANPYYAQFHIVNLDGSQQRRVTTLDYHHSNFQLSPDKKWLIAQYEEVNRPPCTALYSTDGKLVDTIAEAPEGSAQNLAEMFQFRSNDGMFDIYGVLYKPKDFDPNQKYPVINALYGGPGSVEFRPQYVSREYGQCSRGYLVVKVNNRGTGGRGKAFRAAQYKKMGDVDIQDHADAIRYLRKRNYVDGDRVGIVGHSYGGYMAAIGIFKHPDVYAAAVMRAGVSDWRNYDTIYTERYMSTPQLNSSGYDQGQVMKYVDQFKGKILIMHGMMDDNVHPNNAFQLINVLDQKGKTYESRFWPNAGHGLGRGMIQSQQEFFDRVLK